MPKHRFFKPLFLHYIVLQQALLLTLVSSQSVRIVSQGCFTFTPPQTPPISVLTIEDCVRVCTETSITVDNGTVFGLVNASPRAHCFCGEAVARSTRAAQTCGRCAFATARMAWMCGNERGGSVYLYSGIPEETVTTTRWTLAPGTAVATVSRALTSQATTAEPTLLDVENAVIPFTLTFQAGNANLPTPTETTTTTTSASAPSPITAKDVVSHPMFFVGVGFLAFASISAFIAIFLGKSRRKNNRASKLFRSTLFPEGVHDDYAHRRIGESGKEEGAVNCVEEPSSSAVSVSSGAARTLSSSASLLQEDGGRGESFRIAVVDQAESMQPSVASFATDVVGGSSSRIPPPVPMGASGYVAAPSKAIPSERIHVTPPGLFVDESPPKRVEPPTRTEEIQFFAARGSAAKSAMTPTLPAVPPKQVMERGSSRRKEGERPSVSVKHERGSSRRRDEERTPSPPLLRDAVPVRSDSRGMTTPKSDGRVGVMHGAWTTVEDDGVDKGKLRRFGDDAGVRMTPPLTPSPTKEDRVRVSSMGSKGLEEQRDGVWRVRTLEGIAGNVTPKPIEPRRRGDSLVSRNNDRNRTPEFRDSPNDANRQSRRREDVGFFASGLRAEDFAFFRGRHEGKGGRGEGLS
ncbi:hypothetical protein BC829DRAFT_189439 [Chytridium lagenaria]|nr:hypothetical protein BC829DRAFT_189439 [Chytridium lagenaria]